MVEKRMHRVVIAVCVVFLSVTGHVKVSTAEVKKLDFRNNFNASLNIWQWAPVQHMEKMKILLDNYFEKLGVDWVNIQSDLVLYHVPKRGGDWKKWWDEILSYCQKKGYPLGIVGASHIEEYWNLRKLLKYASKNYPGVVQVVIFGESWCTCRHRHIESTRGRSYVTGEWIEWKDTPIKSPLKNTYTELNKAFHYTLGAALEEVYEIDPSVKIILSNPWMLPEATELIKKPYAKNLILTKKGFGYLDLRSFQDLVREDKILSWGIGITWQGGPYPHEKPEFVERLLKRAIVQGIHCWVMYDTMDGLVLLEDPYSPDTKLTEKGKAFRRAVEFGHLYSQNEENPINHNLESSIAFLRYPNVSNWGLTLFQHLRTFTANLIFSGWGLPHCADNPEFMNAVMHKRWGLKSPARNFYRPPYWGLDPDYFRIYDSRRFLYTTCITPETKVAVLAGPGSMNRYMVDKLTEFCKRGGYVIQSAGAYIRNEETGEEMLEPIWHLRNFKNDKGFSCPTASQIKPFFKDFAGFIPEGTSGTMTRESKCEVVNKQTPLVPFDYSCEYRGGGNSFWRLFWLKGKPIDGTVVVMVAYPHYLKYPQRKEPILIYHPIGKGGVYTVLSWSLTGMVQDRLTEFVRLWIKYLIDKYQGDILKREKVNIYDYEVYAGALLDWEGKPYIEIKRTQRIGIVKNYLDKPIKRTFLIHHRKDESIKKTLLDKEENIREIKVIKVIKPKNGTQKIPVILQPGWTVIFEKIRG